MDLSSWLTPSLAFAFQILLAFVQTALGQTASAGHERWQCVTPNCHDP
jgi:hypothetical protein